VDEWYHECPVTEKIMRGILEYEYIVKRDLPVTRKRIVDNGFIMLKEQTQRPMVEYRENQLTVNES
jgi:hypothetical protein